MRRRKQARPVKENEDEGMEQTTESKKKARGGDCECVSFFFLWGVGFSVFVGLPPLFCYTSEARRTWEESSGASSRRPSPSPSESPSHWTYEVPCGSLYQYEVFLF